MSTDDTQDVLVLGGQDATEHYKKLLDALDTALDDPGEPIQDRKAFTMEITPTRLYPPPRKPFKRATTQPPDSVPFNPYQGGKVTINQKMYTITSVRDNGTLVVKPDNKDNRAVGVGRGHGVRFGNSVYKVIAAKANGKLVLKLI